MANYTYEDIINKDILELMGVSNIPEEKKRELYTKMIETIENRAINQIANMLSEKDTEEWKKIAETKDKQKEDQFLKSKNIDLVQIMLNQTLLYKAEMVDLIKQRGQNG